VRFDRRSIMIVTVAYLRVLLAIVATQFS